MNYFIPVKYHIINIMDKENSNLKMGKANLAQYIRRTFPILAEINDKKLLALAKQNADQYRKMSLLLFFAIDYLHLPRHLLAVGEDSTFAVEPVSRIIINDANKKEPVLINKVVNPEDLGKYYIANYEQLVHNFINPNEEIRQRANITAENLERIRQKSAFQKRKNMKEIFNKDKLGGND